jgi:hypothetical protein
MPERDFKPLFTWRSAIQQSHLPPTVRHVALALSLHMNEMGGSCFPSVATLAEETGRHTETVSDSLRHLETAEFIRIIRPKLQGRGRFNQYEARIPEGSSQTPPSEEKVDSDGQKGRIPPTEGSSEPYVVLHEDDKSSTPDSLRAKDKAFERWHAKERHPSQGAAE